MNVRKPARRAVPEVNGRRPKRSTEEIEQIAGKIVSLVNRSKSEGLTSEDLQALLNVDKYEIARPLYVAADSGRIVWTGKTRGTRYFAPGKAPKTGYAKAPKTR